MVTAGLDGRPDMEPDGVEPVTGEKRRSRSGPCAPLGEGFAASFSSDGDRIVTASSDGFARLWYAESDEAESVYEPTPTSTTSPTRQRRQVCCGDAEARIPNSRSERPPKDWVDS